jgi:hypothetical protein
MLNIFRSSAPSLPRSLLLILNIFRSSAPSLPRLCPSLLLILNIFRSSAVHFVPVSARLCCSYSIYYVLYCTDSPLPMGHCRPVSSKIWNLGSVDPYANDKISWIKIPVGSAVKVCMHQNFGGTCETYRAYLGDKTLTAPELSAAGLHDQISSIDVFPAFNPPTLQPAPTLHL